MHNIKDIRENPQEFKKNLEDRFVDIKLEKIDDVIIALDRPNPERIMSSIVNMNGVTASIKILPDSQLINSSFVFTYLINSSFAFTYLIISIIFIILFYLIFRYPYHLYQSSQKNLI